MTEHEAPELEFTAELRVQLGAPLVVGPTPRGLHRIIPIVGGTVEGPGIQGKVLSGGADWQYVGDDGSTEVDARYTLQTHEGTAIGVVSRGIRTGPREVLERLARGENVRPDEYYFRTAMRFEAPHGRYEWLAHAVFLARGQRRPDEVLISVWRVL